MMLIEAQTGAYLGEGDTLHHEDIYAANWMPWLKSRSLGHARGNKEKAV